ncbi:MAG: hypothetical protein QXP41_00510 [Candidatus Nitrosocaldus sp.]
MYPGEVDFREVSECEFYKDIHPHDIEDMVGEQSYGLVYSLDASLEVYDPDKRLVVAKRWPARSYTRWFARIIRMLFSFTNENFTDVNNSSFQTSMTTNNISSTTAGLMGNPNTNPNTGALIGIGQ